MQFDSFHKPLCTRCLDAGVVEAAQGNFKTLLKCNCKQGKEQVWALPAAPMQGFTLAPLDWREYKPSEKTSQKELIAWHTERVRNAEQFWASQEEAASDG